MKCKNFNDYLKKRLNEKEISDIKSAAKVEYEILKNFQHDIANAISRYMQAENIGFNDFVNKIGKSPSQVSKILKGEANLTLMTVAQIFAIIGHKAHIIYK